MCALRFLLFSEMDQRNCIKFYVQNEIKCAKTIVHLTAAFGEAAKNRTQVQLWHKRFRESREDLTDNDHSGRPSTPTTNENFEVGKKMIIQSLLQWLLMIL